MFVTPSVRKPDTEQPLLQSSSEGKTKLTDLSGIISQLSKERDRLHQQLSRLNPALEAFAGIYPKHERHQASKEDIGQRPRSNCRSSESTLGKGKGRCRSSQKTNNVSLGPSKDRSRTKGQVGKAKRVVGRFDHRAEAHRGRRIGIVELVTEDRLSQFNWLRFRTI
jgi:hypothetical protein